MAKRTSRASGSAGRKVFSASSASSSRPKASAGAAEHYAFRHAKNQSSSHGGSEVGGVIDLIEADPLDTYALSVKKHKRANVSSALTREEEAPGPGGGGGGRRAKRRADAADDESGRSDDDDDGVEDGEAVRERLRKLVNSHELLELEAGSEDEELDSDSAFEDDDEGRGWAAAFVHKAKGRRGKQPSKGKKTAPAAEDDSDLDIDLSEGESAPVPRRAVPAAAAAAGDESDEADFESDEAGSEGFVDLSTFLADGQGYPVSDDDDDDDDSDLASGADEPGGVEEDGMDMEEDEGTGDEDEDDEDEGEGEDDDDDDDDDDEAQDKLASLIMGLPSSKRKAESDDEGGAAAGSSRAKRRVLKDRNEEGRKEGSFGAPLNTTSKLSLQTLLAPLPAAQSSSLLNSTKALAAPNSGAALPAPLPTRAQDKLDREAAYEATKGEVTKWGASMKRIKEAEHLSFPLQATKQERPSAAALTAKFQPKGDFESAVASLISSAQMGDDAAIAKREELALSNLTIEEVAARRAELAHMRELMFRAETKAKRVAKIKSKTYRKIVRKEADRNAEKLAEAGFGEDEDELRIKKDRDRAIERATLKHKNTGKWAKAMLNKGDDLDIDQRRELNDQLQEGERLKQRIQGRGDGSESESSDEDGGDEDLETLRDRAFTEIDGLNQGPDEEIKTKSGLFQMKFMTDARKRAADQTEGAVDDFRREMDHLGAEDAAEGSVDEDAEPRQPFTTVGGNAGRQVFGQSVVPLPKHGRPPASDISTATLQSSNPSGSPPRTAARPEPTFMISTEPEPAASNPWLTAGASASSSSKISRKKNAVSGKEASAAEKSAKAFKKSLGKVEEAREREQDDAMVDIDPSQVSLAKKAGDKGKGRARAEESEDEDEESQDDHERKGPLALRQRDLVAQAFAGDNVLEDFAEEKRKEEDRDKPQDVDTSLPGWGSWGGRGVKKPKTNKKNIKHVPGVDVSKRRDFAKSHVIISEKKDKKAAKHMTKDLPYPYTSAAQYEASLRGAVGSEWSTRATVQKATMPRVVTKMGTIIHPLQKQW